MNDCGISKLDLKRRNRMQILRVVREQGPISRVDISTALQITRAAVTIITNEMISQHILEEIGEEPVEPVRQSRRDAGRSCWTSMQRIALHWACTWMKRRSPSD